MAPHRPPPLLLLLLLLLLLHQEALPHTAATQRRLRYLARCRVVWQH
jgi:hypothetical protein